MKYYYKFFFVLFLIGISGIISSCIKENKFEKNEIFNIGGSESVKLMRFIKIIENNLGLEANIEYLPLQPGDVKKTNSDNRKLESIVGYSPQIDIETGIKHFIEWYKKYYHIT